MEFDGKYPKNKKFYVYIKYKVCMYFQGCFLFILIKLLLLNISYLLILFLISTLMGQIQY